MQFRILVISVLSTAVAIGCASQQKPETARPPEAAAAPLPAKILPAKPKLQTRTTATKLVYEYKHGNFGLIFAA